MDGIGLNLRAGNRREKHMCCTTKIRIAEALRELMLERSLRKITVQDIMERTNMKRQSFYYHFKDVYDVLEWEINRRLGGTLQYDPDQSCETWCRKVLGELERDRSFYHKALQAMGMQKTIKYIKQAMEPHICQLVLEDPYPDLEQLSEEQTYLLDFFGRSLCGELINQVMNREAMDFEHSCRRVQMLCRMAEQCAQIPNQLSAS